MPERLKPDPIRRCLAVLAGALCTSGVMAAGAADSRWQCAPAGGSALVPALAEAAGEYLARVEALYPYQMLGLVRAGDRFYLLNSRDVEWGERARLNLLALRLRESYLAAERQATGAPGSFPPPGGFVCLAAARAAREGLTRTPPGEIVLAAGQSLHLVDPQEPLVAVEVRAAPDRSLNLGDIFHRSARAGIYAGLAGKSGAQARQPGNATPVATPGGTLIFRVASAGTPVVTTRVDVDERDGSVAAAPLAAAPKQATPAIAELPPAKAAPVPSFDTAKAGTGPAPTAAPRPMMAEMAPSSEPAFQQAPQRAVSSRALQAVAEPLQAAAATDHGGETGGGSLSGGGAIVAAISASGAPKTVPIPAETGSSADRLPASPLSGAVAHAPHSAGEQSYDDYAKIMKTLMALRRSGGVRSISEMTYVHPAVELIRRHNP